MANEVKLCPLDRRRFWSQSRRLFTIRLQEQQQQQPQPLKWHSTQVRLRYSFSLFNYTVCSRITFFGVYPQQNGKNSE